MKRICQNCQYYRDGKWCSNFVSEHYRYAMAIDLFVHPENTCEQFTAVREESAVMDATIQ